MCSESESQREVPHSDSEEEATQSSGELSDPRLNRKIGALADQTPTVTGDELAEEPTAGKYPDWKWEFTFLFISQGEKRHLDILQEEEEPVTSGDNDLQDIAEIQPGTEDEMFIMR